MDQGDDRPDDAGSKHLWNVRKLLPDYMVQNPRRQPSSYSPPWKPEISPSTNVFLEMSFESHLIHNSVKKSAFSKDDSHSASQ
jgi:hypothetical protein